ncbi:MAG: hypothetical protein V3U85_01180 [Hyphomicrobium sp.]
MMLRALSWKQLKAARRARSTEAKEEMKELGAEIIAAYVKGGQEEAAARRIIKEMEYEPGQFDTPMLLSFGIDSWSYGDGKATNEKIETLDERTAVWAKQEIINMTKPPSEEEQKKASGVSTAT